MRKIEQGSQPFKCQNIQHATNLKNLNITIQVPGLPGDDYPVFSAPPETSFVCDVQPVEGYYADQEVFTQIISDNSDNMTI